MDYEQKRLITRIPISAEKAIRDRIRKEDKAEMAKRLESIIKLYFSEDDIYEQIGETKKDLHGVITDLERCLTYVRMAKHLALELSLIANQLDILAVYLGDDTKLFKHDD